MPIYAPRLAERAIAIAFATMTASAILDALDAIAAETRALLADLVTLRPIARRFGWAWNCAVDDRQLRLYRLRQTRAQFRAVLVGA